LAAARPDLLLRSIVFPLDYSFRRDPEGRLYSDRGVLPWERYLLFASEIVVVSRPSVPAGSPTAGMSLATHERVRFVEVPSLSGPLIRFTNRPRVRAVLEEELRNADALLVRLPGEIGALAFRIAERLQKRIAVELVACTWDALWNYGTWQGRLHAPYSWLETRRLVRRAPHVLYVSDRFLQRRYPTSGYAVGCSDVDVPDLDDEILDRRLKRIRAAGEPFVIGMIGALYVRYKGFRTALDALAESRSELPPFEFRILGAGDPAEVGAYAAEMGLSDRVVFSGTRTPGAAVRAWLDEVDLYIQPSFQEGLPRAMVEALSRACPCVGSSAGGIPELLDPECVHEPGDARHLAQLILTAANGRGWQEHQAARNFEVAKRFQASALDRRREQFFAAALGAA